jgi:hypothetical protein
MANPGFASVDQRGVLIDLQGLQTLALESDGTLNVGIGNHWVDVYGALDSHGLGAVGGRHNDVGVAGFLLGGELSVILISRG